MLIYHRTDDDTYWCKSIYDYNFWKRYLNVFDAVKIVARVKDIREKNDSLLKVSGENVEIYGIPFYQGPKELLINYFKIHIKLLGVGKDCDAALIRLPSQTGFMVNAHLKNIPVAGEIVYDIYDDIKQSNDGLILNLYNRVCIQSISKE